jgi:hypothetical protein
MYVGQAQRGEFGQQGGVELGDLALSAPQKVLLGESRMPVRPAPTVSAVADTASTANRIRPDTVPP